LLCCRILLYFAQPMMHKLLHLQPPFAYIMGDLVLLQAVICTLNRRL
jgi:hypothetical protein